MERPDDDDFADQLSRHVNERERVCYDYDVNERKRVCNDYTRLAPSRRCKWGKSCREIDVCSYYHGDSASLSTQFCSCFDADCPRPHPNRAKKVARRKVKREGSSPQSFVCKKCGGSHRIMECPGIECFKCKRWGHMPGSYKCEMSPRRKGRLPHDAPVDALTRPTMPVE